MTPPVGPPQTSPPHAVPASPPTSSGTTALDVPLVPLSPLRRRLVVVGVLTGMFLGALEATVVSGIMPTVVSSLGGLGRFSWVFSAYLLTSTLSIPVWGRLSDHFGRRRFYLFGAGVFLAGSALSGQADGMTSLIFFRVIQGLGAGALVPIGLVIAGDIFPLEQRARFQALFSSVWGLSSTVGPLIGAWVTMHWGWRWVFYLNLPFGVAAITIVGLALKEPPASVRREDVDWRGAGLLLACVGSLCFALLEGGRDLAWTSLPILGCAAVSLAAGLMLVRVEREVPLPMLPPSLFHRRIFSAAALNGFLLGTAMFGLSGFVPLFIQGGLGQPPGRAASAITPYMVGWMTTSVVAMRVILRTGYRGPVFTGVTLLVGGVFWLTRLGADGPWWHVYAAMGINGAGMGLNMAPMLLAAQNSVGREDLGIATSSLQFFRMIGGAVGTAILGAVLNASLTARLESLTAGPAAGPWRDEIARLTAHPDRVVDPVARAAIPEDALRMIQGALADSLHQVFLAALALAALAWMSAWFVPRGRPHTFAIPRTGL